MNDPIQQIKSLVGNNNPQQVAMQMLGNNNNPMLNNLIKMARDGNTQGIENFARNFYKERGRDFDKEFTDFMSNFK